MQARDAVADRFLIGTGNSVVATRQPATRSALAYPWGARGAAFDFLFSADRDLSGTRTFFVQICAYRRKIVSHALVLVPQLRHRDASTDGSHGTFMFNPREIPTRSASKRTDLMPARRDGRTPILKESSGQLKRMNPAECNRCPKFQHHGCIG